MSRDGKLIGYGLLLCAAALTGFLCWGIAGIRADFASAAGSIAAIPPSVRTAVAGVTDATSAVRSIVPEITRPCKGLGLTPEQAADACGFLAETKLAEVHVRDAVTTTQLQVAGSQKLMNAAASAITGAAGDLQAATGHLDDAIDQGKTTIASLQPAIDNLPDIETNAQLAIAHIDALASSDEVKNIILNGAKTSASVASIANEADKVAAKEGNSILHPNPWKASYPWMMLGAKTGACIWAGAC